MFTRSNKMLTRSSKVHPVVESDLEITEVYIDFDYASKCWRENKKQIDNGMFVYICGYTLKNGNLCERVCKDNEVKCNQHK